MMILHFFCLCYRELFISKPIIKIHADIISTTIAITFVQPSKANHGEWEKEGEAKKLTRDVRMVLFGSYTINGKVQAS